MRDIESKQVEEEEEDNKKRRSVYSTYGSKPVKQI